MKNIFSKFINTLLIESSNKKILMSSNRIDMHSMVITKKPLLKYAFNQIHQKIFSFIPEKVQSTGKIIELGAGATSIKSSFNQVISSDIVKSNSVDLVLDAHNIDLRSNTIDVLICQNSFHHFHDPQTFFREADKALKIGGLIIILDPYFGPFASFLFKRLFTSETFDINSEWKSESLDPMNGANQALSYIVFFRDIEKFKKLNPNFEIIYTRPSGTHLTYLFSGGLNFKQLLPASFDKLIISLENKMQFLNRLLSIHHYIVVKKIK